MLRFVKISHFIFIILLTAKASAVGTYSLYFGGGGDPAENKKTIFLNELVMFSIVSDQKKWNMTALHDGGHSVDDGWISKNRSGQTKDFSVAEFEKSLKQTESKIQTGKIKPGDQVLVFITTHGSEKENKVEGHKIVANDGDIQVSKLKKIRDLAENKGIKLAIVDTSCFGGATLALATRKTCVLSMSADDVAYTGDSTKFLAALKNQPDLESAFLAARSSKEGTPMLAQPQISTAAGQLTRKKLEILKNDIHDPSRVITSESSPYNCVSRNKNIGDFEKILAELNATNNPLSEETLVAMKKKLSAYRETEIAFSQLADRVKKLDKETCFKTSNTTEYCLSFSAIEFNIAYYTAEIRKNKDPYGISKKIIVELNKIKAGLPFLSYSDAMKKASDMSTQIYQQTVQIAQIERELYSKIYDQYSKKNKDSNPCRNFKI